MQTNPPPLFLQSAVSLAHSYWQKLLQPGSTVIDATCGNGKDTLTLLKLILPTGKIFACDIQEEAILRAKKNIESQVSPDAFHQISFVLGCHSQFPTEIQKESIDLVVYNLGYLPGANKSLITKTESTLQSLRSAQSLLKTEGALSIVCYPGHVGGDEEEAMIAEWSKQLSPLEWIVCHHTWNNRNKAPSLFFIIKIK